MYLDTDVHRHTGKKKTVSTMANDQDKTKQILLDQHENEIKLDLFSNTAVHLNII